MERLHKALGKSELRASRPTIDVSLSESSRCLEFVSMECISARTLR